MPARLKSPGEREGGEIPPRTRRCDGHCRDSVSIED
jgi:hypothetical protein